MPEGLEAELYRRSAERALGRRISAVVIDDRQAMASEIRAALPAREFTATRRFGKVVELGLSDGGDARSLGLHFGMTGRLVVDGEAAISELEYSSGRDDPAWDRLHVTFTDGGVLRVNDPRRWANFTLDPTSGRFGPDFLTVSAQHLLVAFSRRRTAVKTALLDQSVVAGYGNLSVDELLWQTGICPTAPARDVSEEAVRRLTVFGPPHLLGMLERGGSHRGTISPAVRAGLPPCPRDGAPLRRDLVGGRTTIWCPEHQV